MALVCPPLKSISSIFQQCRIWTLGALLTTGILWPVPASAQPQPTEPSQTAAPDVAARPPEQTAQGLPVAISPESLAGTSLTVGVKPIVPFVFVEESDTPYGYSIDLWTAIADKMEVETDFVVFETVTDLLDAVRQGEVDVAIAGISITDEREASGLDFSYPVYQAGLQMVAVDRSTIPFLRYVGYVANGATMVAIVRVLVGCLIVGGLIWAIERKHNPSFQHGPIAGVGQGIWFALATLGTFGYGDVTPTRPWSRLVAVVWMGASFFILADFIAAMSTAYQANTPIRSLEDVYNRSVAAISGSTAADFLRGKPVNLVELDIYEDIFQALQDQEVSAAVIDYPTAKYEVVRQSRLLIAGERLNREDYGIAVQEGQEALLEEINRDILALQQEGFLETLDERWFGDTQP